jgi:CBS domain-containing protein
MKIKDIMHEILRVPHKLSVADVALLMGTKETGSVLLENNGKPVGLITERDILRKVVSKNMNPSRVNAIEIASYPFITVGPEESVEEAARKMGEHNIRRILVEKDGKIIGKVTAGAINKNVNYAKASSMIGHRPGF